MNAITLTQRLFAVDQKATFSPMLWLSLLFGPACALHEHCDSVSHAAELGRRFELVCSTWREILVIHADCSASLWLTLSPGIDRSYLSQAARLEVTKNGYEACVLRADQPFQVWFPTHDFQVEVRSKV